MFNPEARAGEDTIRLGYCQRRMRSKTLRRPSEFFVLEFVSETKKSRFCLRVFDDKGEFQSVEGIALPVENALMHILEIYGLGLKEWKLCDPAQGTVLFNDPTSAVQKEQLKVREAFAQILSTYAKWPKAYEA